MSVQAIVSCRQTARSRVSVWADSDWARENRRGHPRPGDRLGNWDAGMFSGSGRSRHDYAVACALTFESLVGGG